MGAVQGQVVLRRIGFASWLGALYFGLLYLAVGVLGVSEVVTRFGDQSAMIFHVVGVVDDSRQQNQAALDRATAMLAANAEQLETAVVELRRAGIKAGLPLEKIQPVIDNYDVAPRLATLLGRPVDPAIEQDWADRAARVMELQANGKRLRGEIDGKVAALRTGWAGQFQLTPDANGRTLGATDIEVAAGTASTLRRLGFGDLFLLPHELLTLVLALTMGGLGSTLAVTKIMVEGVRTEPAAYYLARPFQGMVTALVIYVVLKAGQLTISSGGPESLNNFFVAFAGIVSGLMSEEAYGVIEKAGAALLKTNQGEARWAFGLKEALNNAKVDADTLAEGIGVSPTETRAWLAESQPVPAPYQRLIAVWLHLPDRQLFTSQAPDKAEAAAPGPADQPEPQPEPLAVG